MYIQLKSGGFFNLVGKKEENLTQVSDLKILVELILAGGTGLKRRTSTNFLQAKTRRECNFAVPKVQF